MGIGKSTLAAQCIDAAREFGGSAYLLSAHRPEVASPVGLWTRLAEFAERAGPVPEALGAQTVEQLHPHARYAAVLALVRGLGPAPVVVVIDDLHCADESSA